MKTPVQWVTELRSDKQLPNARQLAECAAIQADAWKQGMSDAAAALKVLEGRLPARHVRYCQRQIKAVRDERKAE